mgnify:CR=1 FL=1
MKIDLIKDDRAVKIDFLVKFLFGGYNPTFSHKLIMVERYRPKEMIEIKDQNEKVLVLYSGVAKLTMYKKDSKYESELLSGSLLSDPSFE